MLWWMCFRVNAQWMPAADKHLDTLSLADRLSVRTNGTDWLIMVPNVGVEYDLGSRNDNRLAAALNLRWKWATEHTYVPNYIYNVFEIKGEVRSYWRTRQVTADEKAFPRHTHLWDKLFSLRRQNPRHPVTTYYRGVWLSYATYAFRMSANAKYARQGSALMGGVLYGIQRPLYRYPNGHSIDLDVGFSVGAAYVSYDAYSRDEDNNRYRKRNKQRIKKIVPFPIVNEIRAGLVYRLGTTPVYDKYNFRYDIDQSFRNGIDDRAHDESTKRNNAKLAAEIFEQANKVYHHKLDSVLRVHPEWSVSDKEQQKMNKDSIHQAEKKMLEQEKRRLAAQKETDRLAEKERKAARKQGARDAKDKEEEPGASSTTAAAEPDTTETDNKPEKETQE